MTASPNGPGPDSAFPIPNDATSKNLSPTDQTVDDTPLERKTSQANSVQGSSSRTDRPKKKRSFLRVPSRASSNIKQEGQSTGPDSQDEAENNTTSKKRADSRASSRRSRRVKAPDTTDSAPKVSTPDIDDKAKPERASKGSSKLFSFLSCCSSSSQDQEDVTVPPKKSTKPQSSHGRQATPVEKAEPSAADSSTADSREPVAYDEKSTLKVNTDRRESQVEDEVSVVAGESSTDSFAKRHLDERPTLPPPSNSASAPKRYSDEGSNAPHGLPTAATSEQPPPANPINVSVENNTNAAIPVTEQRNGDGDATMQDGSSRDSYIEEDDSPISHEETTQQAIQIPPPPPRDRNTESGKQVPPVPAIPQEKQQWLLPPIQPHLQSRKCLVLDLDETLVHSSFKVLEKADFTIPVEIEGQYHNIYVIKRPGVDQFMKRVGELYEVVVFTASVSKYGDPLLDQLDIHNVVHHRLFRDSCYNHQGNYVKDLSQVGRDLRETIIIDNSPTSYIFHPQHAIPISSWFSDAHDNELLDLIPVLEDLAGTQVRDVSLVLNVAL
ncbi:hypothetical protein FQN51_006138 [Onygenales sp. PD_10]|nr:hypothetical protein FQN51_006138 [Onygenales sp. PD_10]